ncbi:hypothetical protein [Desulfatitalea alkaliphila]|uniref:START domain-containing protein n=1 Tax=Desulfatitalea alkaliphila TaxID=2929485 RepID=A0AA41UL08_9BACT|nr:hypothetical protein [Desulfatitalea alkaliphila]MCJ8502874.1 hypothetical protein [Desulfatitalea alkaliphila]
MSPLFRRTLFWAILFGAIVGPAGNGAAADGADPRNADGRSNRMPIALEEAFLQVIDAPDWERLATGEIITRITRQDADTVVAQSMGRIQAPPRACFEVVRRYDQYTTLMPHTVESKVLRAFALDAPHPGAEAVDFWTRIRVFGFSTGYLLRIAHLPQPCGERLDIYWTLVDDPSQTTGCLDADGQPCANDLALNLGAHRFEPFPGDPDATLHTYTLTLKGTRWYQRAGLRLGAGHSMADVVGRIREALHCTE